jgi:DNA polymerase III delta subunit
LQEVQRTLETIQPGQAKEQILLILDEDGENSMNDVVAMIRAMPLDKRKKIFGEFKSKVEVDKMHDILQQLREGEPEISLIRDAQQQLQGS